MLVEKLVNKWQPLFLYKQLLSDDLFKLVTAQFFVDALVVEVDPVAEDGDTHVTQP